MKTVFSKTARLRQVALLALSLALGACAPSVTSDAVTGSTLNSARARLDLAAGQSALVSVRTTLDDLGVDDTQEKTLDIDFNNADAFGRVQSKEMAVSWFKVSATTPNTFSAQIVSSFLGYEIVKTQDNGSGGTTGVRYRPYVRLVLRVGAPASASAGPAALGVTVGNVNGRSGQIPVYLTVHR